MQVILDINETYEAQFMGILQSLDSRIVKKIEVDKDSQFMIDKAYLHDALRKIDSGEAKTVTLEEFEASMDKVIGEYENRV